MSFYYSQFHFLINDDILGVYFSLSITKNDSTNTHKEYQFQADTLSFTTRLSIPRHYTPI